MKTGHDDAAKFEGVEKVFYQSAIVLPILPYHSARWLSMVAACLLFALPDAAMAAEEGSGVVVEKVPPITVPLERASIPWLNESANAGDRALVWEHRSAPIATRVWVGQDAEGLSIRVVVEDPEHHNEYSGPQLWRGDCIYLGIDAWGDSATGNRLGPDDCQLIAALGPHGGNLRCSQHGDSTWNGRNLSQDMVAHEITRDPAAGATTYDLHVPWDFVHSGPGISDTLGLSLTVAHKDAQGHDQRWGRFKTRNEEPRSLTLHRLAPPPFETALAAVAVGKHQLLSPSDEAILRVAFAGGADGKMVITGPGPNAREQRLLIGDGNLQRYRIRVPATTVEDGANRLHTRISAADGAVLVDETVPVENLVLTETRVFDRLDALATATEQPGRIHRRQ